MDVFLNGEPRRFDVGGCANLAELVARAERDHDSQAPYVVVEVAVDGRPVEPEALGALEHCSLEGVRQVSIVRRPRREVALAVLAQGAQFADQVTEALGGLVGDFRAGRTERANGRLADVFDALTVLTGITSSISGELVAEAQAIAERQAEIQPWLEQILDAQSSKDPILLADLLEYEITPRITDWSTTMSAMHARSAPLANGR